MVARSAGSTDLRDAPTYTLAEAAHYLGLPASTLRLWTVGQRYETPRQGAKLAPPVVRLARKSPPTLSFWNLVEVYVLASIRRRHGVALQRVRRAIRCVQDRLDLERPLIQQDFLTDGMDLFIERYSALVNVSRDGQMALRTLLEGSLTRIDRDPQGLAERLYPWWKSPDEPRTIQIDPRIAFGRPILVGTGVPTETIAERFGAGDSVEHLSQDYGLKPEQVEAALRWEQRALAAA